MLDTYGREVRMLRLAVTDACDLCCEYCVPKGGIVQKEIPMSANELVAIAEAAAKCGINKIRLTGGEPLLRPDILSICCRINRVKGIRNLCLTTNGTKLAELAVPLFMAGVKRVNISIDSLKPDRYARLTRCGNLSDVIAGLNTALSVGFEQVKVNCVLIGGVNDDEIADFVELTRFKPLEVRFIELMPMGECAAWPKERFISAETVLQRCPELEPIPSEGVAQRYRLQDAAGTVGLIRPLSQAFCGDCNRIRVTADGMLKPCLHSGEELDLRGLRGDALKRLMAEGIGAKPASHHLVETGTCTARHMSQIGG
jgi:GTP 3',8-cyclase